MSRKPPGKSSIGEIIANISLKELTLEDCDLHLSYAFRYKTYDERGAERKIQFPVPNVRPTVIDPYDDASLRVRRIRIVTHTEKGAHGIGLVGRAEAVYDEWLATRRKVPFEFVPVETRRRLISLGIVRGKHETHNSNDDRKQGKAPLY